MFGLQARGAPLECWSFKLNANDLAFLVDFIVRRERGEAEVRLARWIEGQGRVGRLVARTWLAAGALVAIGDCTFDRRSSHGSVADVSWSLDLALGRIVLDPQPLPLKLLQPFDQQIVSWPCARFRGSVTVGGQRFPIEDVAGSICHYWGQRLPERWYWVSAQQFADEELTVEALLAETRLWGVPWPRLTTGYLFLDAPDQRQFVVSPLNGLIHLAGDPHDFTIVTQPLVGLSYRLHCTAEPASYLDLGEGVRQTLVGTCLVEGLAKAFGTAGLEVRQPRPLP